MEAIETLVKKYEYSLHENVSRTAVSKRNVIGTYWEVADSKVLHNKFKLLTLKVQMDVIRIHFNNGPH